MQEAIDKEAALKLVSDSHNPYHRIVKEFLLTAPTISDIDRSAIRRLCNDIADEVTDIAFNSTHYHIRDCCEAIRKYLEEIGKELGDAGTDD